MAETYLLRGARQLLTLQGSPGARRGAALGQLAVISDGAVLMKDGVIEQVGMTRRVENLAAARHAKVIEATGHVVMPAFVDSGISLIFAHHPAERNDERSQARLPHTAESQRDDILDAVRALKMISKKRLIIRASHLAASLAALGTGTAGVVSGYGLDETGEVKTLRAIQAVQQHGVELLPAFFGANAVPDGAAPSDFSEKILFPLLRVVARRKLSGFAAARCGPMAFDVATARTYLLAARHLGLQPAIHGQQFQHDESVRLAAELDAISVSHLEHATEVDIDFLSRSRTVAVLTPAATLHMDLPRFAPARKMIDGGAAVALATAFNPDQCPTYSMPFNITTACRYLGMSAAEAIVASTINAAHALGRGHKIGTIETGKQADLLILNARDYRELPLAPGLNMVHTMIKAGKVIH